MDHDTEHYQQAMTGPLPHEGQTPLCQTFSVHQDASSPIFSSHPSDMYHNIPMSSQQIHPTPDHLSFYPQTLSHANTCHPQDSAPLDQTTNPLYLKSPSSQSNNDILDLKGEVKSLRIKIAKITKQSEYDWKATQDDMQKIRNEIYGLKSQLQATIIENEGLRREISGMTKHTEQCRGMTVDAGEDSTMIARTEEDRIMSVGTEEDSVMTVHTEGVSNAMDGKTRHKHNRIQKALTSRRLLMPEYSGDEYEFLDHKYCVIPLTPVGNGGNCFWYQGDREKVYSKEFIDLIDNIWAFQSADTLPLPRIDLPPAGYIPAPPQPFFPTFEKHLHLAPQLWMFTEEWLEENYEVRHKIVPVDVPTTLADASQLLYRQGGKLKF